jgi:hypothetical protein
MNISYKCFIAENFRFLTHDKYTFALSWVLLNETKQKFIDFCVKQQPHWPKQFQRKVISI